MTNNLKGIGDQAPDLGGFKVKATHEVYEVAANVCARKALEYPGIKKRSTIVGLD